MNTHYINYNEETSFPKHGAIILRPNDRKSNNQIRLEWMFPSKNFTLSTEVSKSYADEHTALHIFCIPPIGLYLSYTSEWLENRKWFTKWVKEDNNKIVRNYIGVDGSEMIITKHAEPREYSISIGDEFISWRFGAHPNYWDSSTPKWKDGSFDFKKFLFGDVEISKEIIKEKDVKIPFEEKTYDGRGTLYKIKHKRKRWFTKVYKRVNIECPEGVPHPGKGTCSYNCGEDSTYSLSTLGTSIEEGVGKFIGHVLDVRNRYPL